MLCAMSGLYIYNFHTVDFTKVTIEMWLLLL